MTSLTLLLARKVINTESLFSRCDFIENEFWAFTS